MWEKMDTGIFIVSPFALYLKLPQYYHSSPLSFFFNRLIFLFFTELGVLEMQRMFPVRGDWGESVLGLLPGVISLVLGQGPRAVAQ